MGIISNISSDIVFKGDKWQAIENKLEPFLPKETQPHFVIFKLCVAMGIMYDQQSEVVNDGDFVFNVPRTIMQREISDLDFLFQSAVVSSKLINYSIEDRLDLAFNTESKIEFDKIGFLKKFASFGIDKWLGIINSVTTSNTTELMDKINTFVESAKNGII